MRPALGSGDSGDSGKAERRIVGIERLSLVIRGNHLEGQLLTVVR